METTRSQAGNTLPATQQPASCCPIVLLHHPNHSQSSWGDANAAQYKPNGVTPQRNGAAGRALQCPHSATATLDGSRPFAVQRLNATPIDLQRAWSVRKKAASTHVLPADVVAVHALFANAVRREGRRVQEFVVFCGIK